MKNFFVTFMLVLKKYGLTVLLNGIVLVLCFMPTEELPKAPVTDFDKFVHLVMFMALSGVVFFDNTGYLRRKISIRRIVLSSFLFPTLLGGLIEILQENLTSYRSGDWMDFLFDGIGAFLGMLVCFLINSKLKKVNATV